MNKIEQFLAKWFSVTLISCYTSIFDGNLIGGKQLTVTLVISFVCTLIWDFIVYKLKRYIQV
jgi:hypothetical protein